MPNIEFEDHFSKQAAEYARFRPRYPASLFDYLASLPAKREIAWDAGTGNGQVAVALAPRFHQVIATDPSAKQIEHAEKAVNILYLVEQAEHPSLAQASVDLITVAQALHWFDQSKFHAAVRHALKPGGTLAVWCYEKCRIEPAIDAVVERYYSEIVGPYWPPERLHVENGYRDLHLPYPEQASPDFSLTQQWSLNDLLGYLTTWSATQHYRDERGENPVSLIENELMEAWGNPRSARHVEWPISLRICAKPA